MSLIECRECGKQISSHASRCVHCGFPVAENTPGSIVKTAKQLIIAVFLLSAIAGIIIEKDFVLKHLPVWASDFVSQYYHAGSTKKGEPGTATGTAPSIGPRPILASSNEFAPASATLITGTGTPTDSRSTFMSPQGNITATGTSDANLIIKRVIDKDKEIYQAFQALDYKHYWTVEDIDQVVKCDSERKELLYALSALYLVDQNPEYELIITFLRQENIVAMAVIQYYRDMISYRYARHENSLYTTRLQKAFSEIQAYEEKLEKHGWTKVYSKWGQGK